VVELILCEALIVDGLSLGSKHAVSFGCLRLYWDHAHLGLGEHPGLFWFVDVPLRVEVRFSDEGSRSVEKVQFHQDPKISPAKDSDWHQERDHHSDQNEANNQEHPSPTHDNIFLNKGERHT